MNQINLHAAVPVPYGAVRAAAKVLLLCPVATVSQQRRLVRSAAPLEIGSRTLTWKEEGRGWREEGAHESLNVLLVGKVE